MYYEFPLSELSDAARGQILQLAGMDESARLRQDFSLELGRAQRLFGSKRYAESLTAFEALRPLADADNRELVGLRIAEAQFYLGRYKQAIDSARPFLNGSRKAEARFFSLSATRGLGDHESYVAEARRLVEQFPNDTWAEEALNNLGTHYILIDEDDTAITVFRDYLTRFPGGRYAQRAAWKVGWAHYRQQKYQDAIAVFEQAAANLPALRLSSAVSLLDGACLRSAREARGRLVALRADRGRLSQLVLRPARRYATAQARHHGRLAAPRAG